MTTVYLYLILGFGLFNYLCTIAILRELTAAEKTAKPAFDLRFHVFKNLGKYRDLTRAKYGRTAATYYAYLISFVLLLISMALFLNSLVSFP